MVDFVDFGYVGLDGDGFGVVFVVFDFFDYFVGWVGWGDVVDYNRGVVFVEFEGDVVVDVVVGIGDEGDFVFEVGGGDGEDYGGSGDKG